MYDILFFYSPNGYLTWVVSFGSYEYAAVNIDVHIFVWIPVFNSLGPMPSSRLAGTGGNSVFNCLRNSQTVSTIAAQSHFHQQCTQAPISPHARQHVLFSNFVC